MVIFNKKCSVNWEEKYEVLEKRYDVLYNKYREAEKEIEELKRRIKATGYLEPKKRLIKWEEILRIKALKKEGMSYRSISKETGWSKATISRVINGYYE